MQQKIDFEAQHKGLFITKPIDASSLNDMMSDIFFGTDKINTKALVQQSTLKSDMTTLAGSKILLVEDNMTNQEVIVGLLAGSDIMIDIANDGKEALEMFENYAHYELILMDMQMPVMDGYEATKRIRKLDKKIPIVALTANVMKEDIQRTKQAGVNMHLAKPIEVDNLYKTLLKFISKKTSKKEVVTKPSQIEVSFSSLTHLDTEHALRMVGGDRDIMMMLKGLRDYKESDFSTIEGDDFVCQMHTLKGISASAGAKDILKLAEQMEESGSKESLGELEEALGRVGVQIDTFLAGILVKNQDSLLLEGSEKEALFEALKVALESKRAKNIKPVIVKIEAFTLEGKDKTQFESIQALVKKFKFKDALAVLS